MKALRSARLILLPLLAVLSLMALVAGLLMATVPTHDPLGQTLALRASMHPWVPSSEHPRTFQDVGVPTDVRHASDGRYIYRKPRLMRAGALLRSHAAAGTATPQVDEAVQTFDVFNPPPAFALTAGQSLTPTNLTPVWTADETMLVFSSNRTATGTAGTRYHLWAIPINGGTPVQLTDSTAAVGETPGLPHGEFFPALSGSNNQEIAFTSDANTANVQNLYAIAFAAKTVTVNGLSSPTFQGADTSGNPLTGIGGVGRPSFSPANADEIIFSGLSTNGTNAGHRHIYFLYQSTRGFNQATASLPGKLTDGPADDTDPAYSQDGQYIAFASTASTLTATGLAPSADPNVAPIATATASGTTPGSNRSIFLLTGGAGVTNSGQAVTLPGTDNFGPAWSSTRRNAYLNPAPGEEYIAFSRGASQTTPHDIFYLQVLQNTQAGGESSRSNGASSTPENPSSPIFQVNAGDTTAGDNFGGFVPDTFLNPNAQNTSSFFVNGGTADPPANPPIVFNTTADPGTPPAIYQTDRSGTFTYTFPNLTPLATYTVRLHLADTKESVAGKRIFNVTVNGQGPAEPNIDIVSTALQSPGRVDGLVTDVSTGNPLPGATITVTQAGTTVTSLTSTAATTPDPTGGTNPINYNGPVVQGSYTVTASATGYGSVSRVIAVNSGAYTRSNFDLSPNAAPATLSGTVTANGNGVSGVTLTVTDAATGVTVATTPSPVVSDPNGTGTGSYGTVSLAPGSYYVTATPPAGSGYTTQTQALTATAATPVVLNFQLQSTTSGTVGTLGGLLTNTATGAPLVGATVTVKDSTGAVVAILTTGASTSPAAPAGDGNPLNYSASLPTGTYSLQFTEPGYASATKSVTVVNTAATPTAPAVTFVRVVQTLATTSATVGPNTAIVVDYTVQVPTFNTLDKNGLVIAPAGAITLAFNPVSGDPPIVQGIEILSDPSPFLSSGFGSFAENNFANPTAAPIIEVFGGSQTTDPNGNPIPPTAINTVFLFNSGTTQPTSYNIYRSTGKPNSTNEPPVSGAGTELNNVYATVPGNAGNSFTDTHADFGSEYYYQATAVYTEALVPESAANAVVHLNTDDPTNVYDDIYPTWSPFLSVFSIAYSSNRSVTYTDPATGTASETAISIGANGSLGNGGTLGANYAGILESQVLNLDPPTLVPYSGNEIIHVNTGSAYSPTTTTRTGVTPGQPATFTVRLSSREAGINDGHVYLQIKDPDSKYQDAQGLEHKVFARDTQFRTQANNPKLGHLDSGSSSYLMNGGSPYDLATVLGDPTALLTYAGFNQFPAVGPSFVEYQRGTVGGVDGPESQTNGGAAPGPDTNKSDSISVGIDGGLGTQAVNTQSVTDANGKPVLDANKNPAQLPGGDPNLFIPVGPEFECQVVNPTFAGTDTQPSDYTDPYWLAGVDDQQPYSGTAAKYRPATEWLPLTRLPAAQQDGQGGVLYSVTWKTPTSQSDYYLDVVAFDKAVAPPVVAGTGSNWRIYDNVWGFSTQSSIGNQDILLVSDYALGQKFAATTFGGQRGLLNLVPKLYGAESYVTDIDDSLLPNAIFRYAVYPGANPKNPQSEVLDLGTYYNPMSQPSGSGSRFDKDIYPVRNGLGVNSYYDRFINDGGTVDNAPAVRSQLYSIWRTLARGPVPASVYAAYEPTVQSQPAVSDAGGAAPVSIAASTVPVATRCIVWISPFTGDVLAGPGTLADSGTQADLRAFVAAGGRLCVSGQDVGSALTQGGTVNNGPGGFLSDVLNATLVTSNQGTHLPAGGNSPVNNRISYIPSYDGELQGGYQELTPGNLAMTTAISARPIRISNNFGGNIFEFAFLPDPGLLGNWRTDGSLDQLGPYIQGFPEQSNNTNSVVGQIDTIKPNTGPNVHTDLTLGPFTNPIAPVDNGNDSAATAAGGIGLIYSENPITAGGGGTGSKVVYATFGLEALSTEYYRQTNQFMPNPIVYLPRNQRQNILHNIVSYLRTGSISGTIRATTGNNSVGAGIPNATVYVQSAYGAAIPGRGTFSATTDSAGNYSIGGLEPGNYTLVAYKTGYSRAVSNPGTVLTIEGDVSIAGANLSLVQGASGIITGIVTDTNSKPVAGATVTFTTSDGQNQSAVTDANGSYTLANVPPGTYTGTAAATGSSATSPQETVTSGGTITVNFKLAAGAGSATGQVVDLNGNPIVGATVFFNGGGLPAAAQATTNSTGTYTFPATGLPAGTYTVTATATGFGVSTPIQVVITSAATTTVPAITLGPVVNGTLGGLVTAANSAAPLTGVTITIVNTASGQTVSTTSVATSSPAAPAGDGNPLNYSITLPQGTYTVTASENGVDSASQTVTVPPNAFIRADFTGSTGLQPVHTFPAGLQFVSTPYDYSALGFNGLFGTLNTALTGQTPNGNRSNVAVWNPLTGAYALDPTAPADALRLGVGYWVYLAGPTAVLTQGAVPTGTVQVPLNPSWNQIGVPSASGVLVSSLTFTGTNGTTYSFADATGSTYHLAQATLYSYNGTAYQPISTGATLQPWQAYWIRVFTPVTLNIPTGH